MSCWRDTKKTYPKKRRKQRWNRLFRSVPAVRYIQTLVDFVQNPYFTDQNVEKEKGIIGQEIDMYADNPDWRVYFGLIEAMYQKHPVHIDIAGTVEVTLKVTII